MICLCGCGLKATKGSFKYGHRSIWVKQRKGKYFCKTCNKVLIIKTYYAYYGIPNYCSGHNPNTEESNRKRSKALKGIPKTKEHIENARKAKKGKSITEEHRKNLSESHKGQIAWNKGISWSKEHKQKLSKIHSGKVLSSQHLRAIMKSGKASPNKSEILLDNVLNNLFPGEYKFVGDGEVIIAGKNPDFININGKKKIIELYGNYWHRNDNFEDRINTFIPYGYDTAIVWDSELKNASKLKQKLLKFHQF